MASTFRDSSDSDSDSDSDDDSWMCRLQEKSKPFRLCDTSSDESDPKRPFGNDDDETDDDSSSLEKVMKKLAISSAKPKLKLDWSAYDESDDESVISNVAKSRKDISASYGSRFVSLKDFEESAWVVDKTKNEAILESDESKSAFPPFCLPAKLYNQLYLHQKIGVQWLVGMHQTKVGGILADDMGLGKTYQTLTCIGGLVRAKTIRNALVVAPVSVLRSWEKEANRVIKKSCVKNITITVVNSEMSKNRRTRVLESALTCTPSSPQLVIVTYGLVSSTPLLFCSDNSSHFWDYVVLDEGHKIKNPSAQVTKACHRICRNANTRRLLLTGTPIQNNLKELHALLDWSTSGRLLGPFRRFDKNYGKPIELGRDRNASDIMIRQAKRANEALQKTLKPHFLQRLKTDVLTNLPGKTDYVIWTHLSNRQRSQYENYVNDGETVKSVLSGELTSPLEAVTWLKKLCGHPLLVHPDFDKQTKTIEGIEPSKLIKHSAKLQVLIRLVDHLSSSGHRTLIFSQSTMILDIIERVLEGVKLLRIDGSTKEKDRQHHVESFNDPFSERDVMLVSTKAGGLGLTLTGADRAIIYDPAWNPAEDSQAVDRCYRIGQRKPVTVYRLVAAGTVEEKMYEKQIHKDGIRRAVMTSSGHHTKRYFDRHELRKLFKLDPMGECSVLEKLRAEKRLGDVEAANEDLLVHHGIVGISSHDSVYEASPTWSALKSPEPFGGSAPPPEPSTPIPATLNNAIDRKGRHLQKGDADLSSSKSTSRSSVSGKENKPYNIEQPSSHEEQLSKVQELKLSGQDGDALEILFGLLEFGGLQREKKLEVHTQIALLAHSFGWI